MVDDAIHSGNQICSVVQKLQEMGASKVVVAVPYHSKVGLSALRQRFPDVIVHTRCEMRRLDPSHYRHDMQEHLDYSMVVGSLTVFQHKLPDSFSMPSALYLALRKLLKACTAIGSWYQAQATTASKP